MFLVDTSVWFDFFKSVKTPATAILNQLVQENGTFALTPVVYQELLQGAASQSDFNKLDTYLKSQEFLFPLDEINSYKGAAKIYFDCRRKGIRVRSTIDCLIAHIAIENKAILLHSDNDFKQIRKVIPTLKLSP